MFPMIKYHEIWPCLGYPPFWDKPSFWHDSQSKKFLASGVPEGRKAPSATVRRHFAFVVKKKWKNGPNHTMTSPRQNTENKSIGQNNSVSLTINIQQYRFHHIHIMTPHENHLKSDWNNPVLVHRLDPQATFSRPLSILLWHASTDPSPAFVGKTRWVGPSIPEEFHHGRVVQLHSYFDGKNRGHLDAAGLEAPGAENILKAMTFQEGHHQLLVAVSHAATHAWWLGNRENEEKEHRRKG